MLDLQNLKWSHDYCAKFAYLGHIWLEYFFLMLAFKEKWEMRKRMDKSKLCQQF